ncbi:hypothetical protein QR680_016051 [Steinernema hermaphroditum]|uniref:Methyltransferase FkbM domain-containing protein n=1 Tax=Steinernema hermaphroditum TaxID=289476 RepID=A0AA39H9V5_9BILA|nr:hypothetical protein QR680_016051 [Steinernema hermaphroditum]
MSINVFALPRIIQKGGNGTCLLFVAAVLIIIRSCSLPKTNHDAVLNIYTRYRQCIEQQFRYVSDQDIWRIARSVFYTCEQKTSFKTDGIKHFPARNKITYVLMPNNIKVRKCNVLTIGVGSDVTAEKFIRRTPLAKCHFYGTDPDSARNEDLYQEIGKFFPFAIGNATRKDIVELKGLNNIRFEIFVEHVELMEFLRDHVGMKPGWYIDLLLMDMHYGEYEVLQYFLRDGPIEKEKYTICQWNLDIHEPRSISERELFGNFVRRTAYEGRYIPLSDKHAKYYLINIEDSQCFNRYVNGILF